MDASTLDIGVKKIGYIATLLKEYEATVPSSGLHDGGNPVDDEAMVALESGSSRANRELEAYLKNLNDDEKLDLVTLMWMGRDELSEDSWDELRETAIREGAGKSTADYIMGTPLAAQYLEDALNELGYSVMEVEADFQV